MSRKPHQPTEQTRKLVRSLSGIGLRYTEISSMIGLGASRGTKTLVKYYANELAAGVAEANATVSKTLFEMATKDRNVAAAIFWAKARMGWREKHELDVTSIEEGKKQKAVRESRTAGQGTEWGDDLISPVVRLDQHRAA